MKDFRINVSRNEVIWTVVAAFFLGALLGMAFIIKIFRS
jgi:hypothetical protein